jgi:hypothetical protein
MSFRTMRCLGRPVATHRKSFGPCFGGSRRLTICIVRIYASINALARKFAHVCGVRTHLGRRFSGVSAREELHSSLGELGVIR